ncbi:MAG: hypothetical protein C5B59_07425 [Bacteroidetes bacterium]|nr:MAG: hypothetical protein C5B59_07425 [Bacteroidota bacterium]
MTLDQLIEAYKQMASICYAPHNYLPTYGKSHYGPTSYVKIDDKGGLFSIALLNVRGSAFFQLQMRKIFVSALSIVRRINNKKK